MNLLSEFEKRYTGNPEDTMAICEAIAKEFGLDADETADYIYIHRYEDSESLEEKDLDK
jgi:hypothetical protein